MTKLWRGLALLWLGGFASPMLTAGVSGDALAAAAGTDEHRYGPPRLERTIVADQMPPSAHGPDLVASTAIIGRPVRDRIGSDAGIIRDVLVDARTGAVRFALLGSSDGSFDVGDRTVAVPWPLMHVPAGAFEMARVDMAADRIEAAAEPAAGPGPAAQDGLAVPAAAAAALAGDGTLIPAGRMLGAPVYAAPAPAATGKRTKVNAAAAAAKREAVGRVSRVVIDLHYGYVAYCALSLNDAYGIATPVPFPAIAWAPDLGGFIYRPGTSGGAMSPGIVADRVAAAATASDLRNLYGRFHAAPYWSRSG